MKQDKNTTRWKKYQHFLYFCLALSVFSLTVCWLLSMWLKVPSDIHIRAYQKQELSFDIPATGEIIESAVSLSAIADEKVKQSVAVDLSKNVAFYGEENNSYEMYVKLFGIIPFKTTEVSVLHDVKLRPVGEPIGIYVKTKGILVLDCGEFTGPDGVLNAPAMSVLKKGDYIRTCNHVQVQNKESFMDMVSSSDGKAMVLNIERDGACFDIKVSPKQNAQGEYKLGIWIRDNAQGVGTMTFIDEFHHFGALGHGINDVDTAALMELESGSLYRTEIVSVKKGVSGVPGEITGLISYSEKNKIGDINVNDKSGIFGTVTDEFFDEGETLFLEPALKQEVSVGPAKIMCCVDNEVKYYDCEITALHLTHDNINRGIELKITDDELLEKTGGIVQGMSGSPLIQNDKFVGAVTHVLVSDPQKGYAIFIENMLE